MLGSGGTKRFPQAWWHPAASAARYFLKTSSSHSPSGLSKQREGSRRIPLCPSSRSHPQHPAVPRSPDPWQDFCPRCPHRGAVTQKHRLNVTHRSPGAPVGGGARRGRVLSPTGGRRGACAWLSRVTWDRNRKRRGGWRGSSPLRAFPWGFTSGLSASGLRDGAVGEPEGAELPPPSELQHCEKQTRLPPSSLSSPCPRCRPQHAALGPPVGISASPRCLRGSQGAGGRRRGPKWGRAAPRRACSWFLLLWGALEPPERRPAGC